MIDKELIDKIRALKISKYAISIAENDEMSMVGIARNHAIDEVLKIIESYKPKWVDNPSPNGWYWITNFCNMDIQCVHVFETKFRGSLGGRFDITEYKGKWTKADQPEKE